MHGNHILIFWKIKKKIPPKHLTWNKTNAFLMAVVVDVSIL